MDHRVSNRKKNMASNVPVVPVPAVPKNFDPKHPYETNPFMHGFAVPVRRKNVSAGEADEVIVNTTTGEIDSSPMISRRVLVDSERFVKVYTAQLGVFFSLPSRAMQLAEVLLREMSRFAGTDMVYLNQAAAERHFKSLNRKAMSKQTYHRALSDLLGAGLIAYSDRPGLFFLNPHVFFNGDRIKFVTEYKRNSSGSRMRELEEAGQTSLPLDQEPTE
jgi:hypothetical protein